MKEGTAFMVRTNRLGIAEALGRIVVVASDEPLYAGTCDECRILHGPTELLVETDDPSTSRTMVEPFAVSVKIVRGGLIVTSNKGQALAARLLTEGYGSVRAVVIKEPTLREAVLGLTVR
jgi:ABC-type uncharacterized transport system ATPase subunit